MYMNLISGVKYFPSSKVEDVSPISECASAMMDKTDPAHIHRHTQAQMQSGGTDDGSDRPTVGFGASAAVGNDLVWTNQSEAVC